MSTLTFFSDSKFDREGLVRQVAGRAEVRCFGLAQLEEISPGPLTVVDASLRDPSTLLRLKDWLKNRPAGGRVIFVTRQDSHLEKTRALAIGATDVVHHPLDGRALLRTYANDLQPSPEKTEFVSTDCPGAATASRGLQSMFAAATVGDTVDTSAISAAGSAAVEQVDEQGLAAWVEAVRRHHSQTYQHCLLVTGTAIAFGKHLGCSMADRKRLSVAAMLHDIGKAQISLAILEKPGPLDANELAIMRKHPELGLEALKSAPGLHPEMIDMVVHHHEYLDGSGYPHGLQANEISDLVRIMTISDVFSALIEKRSYKPPLSGQKAYDVLSEMGPKLDQALLRAFRPVAQMA